MIDHWMTTGLLGANASFQRAAREYAEEYAAAAVAAYREQQLSERNAIGELLCSVADNLGDMPISDEWAAKTAQKASELLERNDYFRAD